jgi:hypothetical protein
VLELPLRSVPVTVPVLPLVKAFWPSPRYFPPPEIVSVPVPSVLVAVEPTVVKPPFSVTRAPGPSTVTALWEGPAGPLMVTLPLTVSFAGGARF